MGAMKLLHKCNSAVSHVYICCNAHLLVAIVGSIVRAATKLHEELFGSAFTICFERCPEKREIQCSHCYMSPSGISVSTLL